MQRRKEANRFKEGDIVKIKPEHLEDGERDDFHVVKIRGERMLGLTRICKSNLSLPFPPITDTGIQFVDTKIYGNVKDDTYSEEFANAALT